MTARDTDIWRHVEAFLYREAWLADENRYEEWASLWADDGTYWVPIGQDDDPYDEMSIIFDNRRRIDTRVRQLAHGHRPTQSPPSRVRRVISNIEPIRAEEAARLPDALGPDRWEVGVCANFLLMEVRDAQRNVLAGRTTYGLRSKGEDSFELVLKKVQLLGSDLPLRTMSFII